MDCNALESTTLIMGINKNELSDVEAIEKIYHDDLTK